MEDEECEECEEGAPAWMATFSDMATLLLTFFVLLLSFANMDIENFKMALGSVKEAFGVNMEVKGDFAARSNELIEFSDTPMSAINANQQDAYNEVKALRKYIEKRNMQSKVEVVGTESGVVLRVKDVALFDTGSDNFTEASQPVLALVEDLFHKSKAVLSIEGHTDNVPIARTRFPSNWELSAARAAAVLRHYVAKDFAKQRLSIAGYGELRPIGDNKTADGRALNRRVEFVFKRSSQTKGRMFDLDKGSPGDDAPPEGKKAQDGSAATEDSAALGESQKVSADNTTAGDKGEQARSKDGKKAPSGDGEWQEGVKDGASKNPFDEKAPPSAKEEK